MKKICFALVAALFAFAACNTKLDNAEDLLPGEEYQPVLQVAMDITAPNATKALKTEWEEEDYIYVIFDQEIVGNNGYDLRFIWRDGRWKADFAPGRDADILAKGSGTFDAAFVANRKAMTIEAHPGDAQPYISYRPTDYYNPADPDWRSKGERVYSYYLTCRANYTVEDGVLKGNIALSLGEDFVHIFIPNLTNGGAIRRYTMTVDPHLVSASFGYYDAEGFGWNTEQASGVNKIPGYPLKGGMSFSGLVYGDIINKVKDYTFTVTDNVDHKTYTFTATGKSLHVGSAIVLPELSNWTEGQAATLPELTWTGGQVAVDLGLPSGIQWASCNLNAMSPNLFGEYVAWGETEETSYQSYNWTTYKWTASGTDWDDVTFSKYTGESNKLDLEDDAAHVNMQGGWRMPTPSDCYELIDNCTWTLATLNGQVGYQIKSNVTGYTDKWIFLPIWGENTMTSYWTNEMYFSDTYNTRYTFATQFNIYEQGYEYGIAGIGDGARCYPFPVRPVYDTALGGPIIDPNSSASELTEAVPLCRTNDNKVLWMQPMNIGATAVVGANSYGNYFQWGDNTGHDTSFDFSWANYKWCGDASNNNCFTKYCSEAANWGGEGSTPDGLTTLLPEDDIATVVLGSPWRMITEGELRTLQTKCVWTWDSGAQGCIVQGQGEFAGNAIFLPAAGCRYGTGSMSINGYWTSTVRTSGSYAVFIEFSANGTPSDNPGTTNSIRRHYGFPVRAVKTVSE